MKDERTYKISGFKFNRERRSTTHKLFESFKD
jgi:hypothetical protein